MDPVTLVAAWMIAGTPPTHGPAQDTPAPIAITETDAGLWAADIADAARRFKIPERWIQAVIEAESGGRIDAVSPKGAMGLMQLMPETWTELRAWLGLGTDPFAPHDNILAGTAYLREMLDRYGIPDFLAAYNAGPARFAAVLAQRQALPEETRRFVLGVAARIGFDELTFDEILTDWPVAAQRDRASAHASSIMFAGSADASWRQLFVRLGSSHVER